MTSSTVLSSAIQIVREARAHLFSIPRSELDVSKKADNSFVTRADKETELFIRKRLQHLFPDHDIRGEEFPDLDRGASLTWLIDPIDGTHSFRHNIPLYGTMLCLMDGEEPIVSVIDLPALDRCYSAAKGLGAQCNDRPFRLVDLGPADDIKDEVIATGERKQFVSCGLESTFDRLMTSHDHVRTYCDCFGHVLAAEGTVGAMVDFNIRLWDCMASALLVREAGGEAVCVGSREDGESKRYDWVFGKPAVVEWILSRLQIES